MEILTFIRYALLVYIVNWHPFFSQFHNVVTAGNASFLSLRLGADVILSSQHVRVLGVVISADLALRSTFQTSAQRAFAIFINSDTSGAHFLQSPLQHSCTLS